MFGLVFSGLVFGSGLGFGVRYGGVFEFFPVFYLNYLKSGQDGWDL